WRARMEPLGWRIREAWDVSATPEQYRAYVQQSRGEFSCVKPSCVTLANAWISDRTLCYLASGKPAVVQHTGKSRVLPDAEGLFRFRNMDEAVRALSTVESDYGRHARLARELAAQFDARDVVARVLERALAATGSDRERATTAGASTRRSRGKSRGFGSSSADHRPTSTRTTTRTMIRGCSHLSSRGAGAAPRRSAVTLISGMYPSSTGNGVVTPISSRSGSNRSSACWTRTCEMA